MAAAEIGVTQRRGKKGLGGVKVVIAGKRGGVISLRRFSAVFKFREFFC